ncbi:F-box protein PP2-B11-like [Impatiens glandulifera]|uniref:F-box protein PP2-B11-like n=1 Tax=Impatiens glandulifera TaxID=253017 RepID=UPI001FB12C03|nr:F-box protein PP2-B11-like [Impatiens glandulifera]
MVVNDNGSTETAMDFFNKLPEGCIAHVLSLTTPQDACRLSLVASAFRSAADSDAVWEAFLPSDYKEIIARGVSPPPPLTTKDLFFHLADNPLIIDSGTKSFSLEKRSGLKCYMLAARDLTIVWSDSPMYWRFTSLPESRFPEVAELISVCWLEIHGKLSRKMLSENTLYGAYLVFKWTSEAYGMDHQPVEVSCRISGGACKTQTVFLDHTRMRTNNNNNNDRLATRYPAGRRFGILHRNFTSLVRRQFSFAGSSGGGGGEEEEDNRMEGNQQQPPPPQPKVRRDGWSEIKMGEYFSSRRQEEGDDDDDGDLEMSFMEVKGGNWKSGLIVEGIEIRPVQSQSN